MSKKYFYIVFSVSIIMNIILLSIAIFYIHDNTARDSPKNIEMQKEEIKEKARLKVKEFISNMLFLPESYDPVELRVDSAFWGIESDPRCVNAASKLIELRQKYTSAKATYEGRVNDIKTFGGTGVFHHFTVERNQSKSEMAKLKPEIAKYEEVLRNRDTSHDGKFIGWWIYNRYRAKSNNGHVSFNEIIVLFDINFKNWQVYYNLDEDAEINLIQMKEIYKEFNKEK